MRTAERRVQYFGSMKDTVEFKTGEFWPMRGYFTSGEAARNYYHYTTTGFSITVDTTQLISVQELTDDGEKYECLCYSSYPVIIKNITDSITVVGRGKGIPIIVEALDDAGQWRTIEDVLVYKCGTGMGNLLLKPNDIAAIGLPIYSGNFKTLIRLKLYQSYSKPFSARINKSQFELPQGVEPARINPSAID